MTAVTFDLGYMPASPVTTWQISPSLVQWTSGYSGDRPGTVMFCSNRLNSGMPYQTSPSGGNCSNDVSGTIFHVKIGSGHAYHVNDEHLRGNNGVVASLDLRIMDAQWLCKREAKYHS